MIFLLKLLGKIVKLCVKLVLLPFRLVLRLVRGSSGDSSSEGGSMVASAATSAATAAASSAAATAGETRDRQAASTAETGEHVDPGVRTNYERFRKALYAYAGFGMLFYVFLWAEFSAPIGTMLVPLVVGTGVPVAIGYQARTGSRLAWGGGMAYAGLFLLLSIASTASVASLGPSATGAFNDLLGGGAVMILGALSLLQMGSLAAALYFGSTGRAVALGGATAVPEAPADGGESAPAEQSTRSGSNGTPTEQSTSAASERQSGTSAPEPTGTTTADAGTAEPGSGTGTGSAAMDAGTTGAETTDAGTPDAGTTDTGPAPPSTTAAESADAEPADVAAASDDGAAGDTAPVVEGLAEEAAETRDPADIRELGDRVDSDPAPDEVITALEACAEADDPDVRVAVCDACAEIPDDEVESILGRLRIDTNDRVATAAMEAY